MPPASLPPPSGAVEIIDTLQRRVIRGITWISAAGAPVLVFVWEVNRRRGTDHPALLLALEAALLGGVLGQVLVFRHRRPRANGWFLVGWLTVVSILSLFHNGPLAGNGIAWACTAMLGVLLVGPRAGAVVVAAFCLAFTAQLVAVRHGWLPLPRDLAASSGFWELPRIGLAGLIPLVMCILGFGLLCRSLAEAVTRLVAERQRSEAAREAQRAAEDRMKANQHFEALGKLASGVAHDVNNALTTVQCNAEVLQFALPGGDEQNLAGDILSASRSAAQTARQLLSLNRRAFCQPASLCPAREAEIVSRLVTRLLPPGIKLTVVPATNRRIFADAGDLQQALINLLLNARDAMPDGGQLTLAVEETAPGDPAGPRVAIRVQDTGTGISPAVLPHIFAPFFTTKGEGRGTGLGLAMVAAFVEEAGGTIAVQSAPGRGTTLTLSFPESAPPPALLPATDSSLPAVGGLRVLLVEDDDKLRAILSRILVRGGYEVWACADAAAALSRLAADPGFDLLCTDGVSSTTDLVATFRRGKPGAPVLLCTGQPDHQLLREGSGAGKVELLRKPFTGTELLARVRAFSRAPG